MIFRTSLNKLCSVRAREREREREREKGRNTASAPSPFRHGIHLGNLVASSAATSSEVSTARCSGVFQSPFLLMPASSWPDSMRNS